MNETYDHTFQISEGVAFAKELKSLLDLGDKLIALGVNEASQTATGTLEKKPK